MTSEDFYMSMEDAAQYLGFPVGAVHTQIVEKGLPAYRVGNRVMLKKSEVDSWMEERRIRVDETDYDPPTLVRGDYLLPIDARKRLAYRIEVIKKRMPESNITQTSIAEACGLTGSAIRTIIGGNRKVTDLELDKIAAQIFTTKDWIITGEGDPDENV